ncbi:MAG: hypothetical protein AB7O50_07935 [Pseudolabrys sp.]
MPQLRDTVPVRETIDSLMSLFGGQRRRRRKRERYFVREGADGWFIEFAGDHFGPYKDAFEAMMQAIDAAQKLGERGGLTQVQLLGPRGKVRQVWNYGTDPAGLVAVR